MTKKNIILYMLIICFVFFLFSSRAFADVEKGEAQYIKVDPDPVYELTIDDNKEGLEAIDAYYNRKSSLLRSSSSSSSDGAAGAPVAIVTSRPDETNYQDTTWYYSTNNPSIVGNNGTYSYYASTTVSDGLLGYYYYDSSHDSVSIVCVSHNATSSDRFYITGVKGSLGFIASNFTYSTTADVYVTSMNLTPNGSDLVLENSSIIDGLNIYDSYAAAVSALTSYDPTPRYRINYILQPGHVVYIPVSGGYSFTLTGAFNDFSKFTGTPWPADNRTYNIISGLPSTSALPSDLLPLTWSRNVGGDTNLLRQTKQGVESIRDTTYTGVGYLCIVNPTYNNDMGYNGNILVAGETYGTIYDYNLVTSLDPDTGLETLIADTSDPYTAEVTSAGTVTTTNSDGETPQYGGGNYIPSADTLTQNETGVGNTIERLLETIVSFFTFPVQLIHGLISSVSSIIEVLGGVFSWLPSELSGMIITALGILIALGVLKHFI